VVPLHAQRCPGEPDRLRWITPPGMLPFTGTPGAVPEPLAALLTDGTLAEVRVEPAAVVTVLGADGDWRRDGPRVRSALHAALDDPAGWIPGAASASPDEPLRVATQALLDGRVGDFARSHGGMIQPSR